MRARSGARYLIPVAVLFVSLSPGELFSQDTKVVTDSVPGDTKGDDWNEFDLGFTTARFGLGVIHEYAAYDQDDDGQAQTDSIGGELEDQFDWRDVRFIANGRFNTQRPFIWKFAIMYDGLWNEWTTRETGLIVGIPELHSEVFIGRQKEGFSLNKTQNGHSTWGNERAMAVDLIQLMTDGIRWYGYWPKPRLFWSAGAYTDLIYEDHRFATWDWIFSGRVGVRPIYTDRMGDVLHLGLNLRHARPDEGMFQMRSKPESNPAPYFLDTGLFAAQHTNSVGGEAYYRRGPLFLGTEFYWHSFDSEEAGDPTFFGGDAVASYILTGETRPYISSNSAFFFVEPERSVLDGGPGAWELFVRYSTFDLDDGQLSGGKFWKINPMLNWYVTTYFRLQLVYGYGVLDRFGHEGATQFFQTRFQFGIF